MADGGRKYYDKIKAIPKYSKCPFCGVGIVSTLDHYLPKTKYPTYALTPVNLIACCADCNKNKKSFEKIAIEQVICRSLWRGIF